MWNGIFFVLPLPRGEKSLESEREDTRGGY